MRVMAVCREYLSCTLLGYWFPKAYFNGVPWRALFWGVVKVKACVFGLAASYYTMPIMTPQRLSLLGNTPTTPPMKWTPPCLCLKWTPTGKLLETPLETLSY